MSHDAVAAHYAWQVKLPMGEHGFVYHTLVASMQGQPPGALASGTLAEVLPMQPIAQDAANQVGAPVVLRVFADATELCALQPQRLWAPDDAAERIVGSLRDATD